MFFDCTHKLSITDNFWFRNYERLWAYNFFINLEFSKKRTRLKYEGVMSGQWGQWAKGFFSINPLCRRFLYSECAEETCGTLATRVAWCKRQLDHEFTEWISRYDRLNDLFCCLQRFKNFMLHLIRTDLVRYFPSLPAKIVKWIALRNLSFCVLWNYNL